METGKPKSSKKALIICAAVLVALIIAFVIIYAAARPQTNAGTKKISVVITDSSGTVTKAVTTDAEYLRGALEPDGTIAGPDEAYGMYVQTVNGITADESQQQWWCFTKGGEMLMTGVDTTPIADGDTFEITLMTGW